MQKELNLDCEQTYDYSGMPEYNNSKQPDPEITGTFTSDDLLSSIFSTFCIGK